MEIQYKHAVRIYRKAVQGGGSVRGALFRRRGSNRKDKVDNTRGQQVLRILKKDFLPI